MGLILALINYFTCYSWVKHIGSPAGLRPISWPAFFGVLVVALIAAYLCDLILRHLNIAHWLLFVIGLAVIGMFLIEILRSDGKERARMIVALVLIVEAIGFFVLYQQMPTSLNFFAINNVHHEIFGMAVNPLNFQALNPFWILVASPILAWGYGHLGKDKRDFSMPAKFTIGMFLCSLSFLSLFVCKFFADAQGLVSSMWIVLSYCFQSIGELLVSGLGLAMVARLIPQRMMGFTMGAWFMSTAVAFVLGGFVASLTSVPAIDNNPLTTLPVYTHVFLEIGIVTFVVAVLMAMAVPILKRYSK